MNWREIFKRTVFILGWTAPYTFIVWGSREGSFYKTWLFLPVVVAGGVAYNIMEMPPTKHPGRHLFFIILLCWLGGLPLGLLLLKVTLGDYLVFCFWVSLSGFIAAVIFDFYVSRRLSRGDRIFFTNLTPDEVANYLGQPKETINQESRLVYLYNYLKVTFTGGRVSEVKKIPPPLPQSIFGLSPEQVVADLGWPNRVVNLDSKVIYFYKDMKIIFVNGQVADVQ